MNNTLTILIFIGGYIALSYLLRKLIRKSALLRRANEVRIKFIHRCAQLGLAFVVVVFGSVLFGIEYSQIGLFFSSVFAVIGVALFAQWSLLSNITASFLIFFGFPFSPGDSISVIEADRELTGVIISIGLLYTVLKMESGDLLSYPNSLLLQRAVVARRTKAVAKIDAPPASTNE